MGFDYVPVEWPLDAPDPQPELRRELESRGFRLLGGCALASEGQHAVRKMAKEYGPHAREFERWGGEPSQVFASPDGMAFAQLAWLWDCHYLQLTTILPDGRVVQTMTDWGAAPRWPTALAAQFARTTDVRSEQRVLATDRTVEIVPGGASATWSAHRERLAAELEALPTHVWVEDFVRIYAAESRSRAVWIRRVRAVAWVLPFVVLTVPFVVVSRLLGEQPWGVDLGVLLVFGLLLLVAYQWLWLRVRRWRWLRPRFRAPLPGAARPAEPEEQ